MCYLGRDGPFGDSASNVDKTAYSIGAVGPPQECTVTSPFGGSIKVELDRMDGGKIDPAVANWTLVLTFQPIMEDEPRMDMMRY